MTVDPGGAPIMRPIWSPTAVGICHQPSAHARMPRSRQVRAYSCRRTSAAAGIAPSEWLIRYVVCSRIGKRSRYAVNSTARTLSRTRAHPWEARAPEHCRCERGRDLGDVQHDCRVVLDVCREHAFRVLFLQRFQCNALQLLRDFYLRRT